MRKALDERLSDAKAVLDDVTTLILRNPGALSGEIEKSFRELAEFRREIDHWSGMLSTRSAALGLLDGLEHVVDRDDCVPLGTGRARFQHVRFLGVACYLATTWALADQITGPVGRVLCTPSSGSNPKCLAKLVSHFIQREKTKDGTAGAIFGSVRRAFGWPVGLSYGMRNHFIHDGAQLEGADFFAGTSAASAFRVGEKPWKKLMEKIQAEYGVDSSDHRIASGWPAVPTDDLRVVLAVCEREMDDALGVLLGSACGSLRTHVGFMIGED
jgi:hypothetical protein